MALFFKQRKPRGFNYTPRYYDPEKEAREERKKIVLGEKYRSPEQRAMDAAAGSNEGGSAENGNQGREYVPGTLLRDHVAARRGNAHVADTMRRRRRKQRSVLVLVIMLALIIGIVYMLYR